jgi:predicted ATPase
MQTTIGPAFMAIKGYAAPEVEHAYARARALCQQMGEAPQLFPVLLGLVQFYIVRAELHAARELAEQFVILAQRVQDPELLLEAHSAMGTTLYYLGALEPAHAHLQRSIAFYNSQQHRSHAFLYGMDPRVRCLSHSALILWLLGHPDQALESSRESLALAQELSHSHSLALALDLAAWLHQLRREEHLTQARAEALIALATEHGFTLYQALGTSLRGWALAQQGRVEEGIAQMGRGLAGWRATGAELVQPYFLALLAEAYEKAGQAEEGLLVLAEALALVRTSGERRKEAELYRLKGELLLARSPEHHPQAEACFHQALALARRQQTKSLELRAAMRLSRLWQQQGKRGEARELLAPIYGWFIEGFDTADLQEAKVLLEELSR